MRRCLQRGLLLLMAACLAILAGCGEKGGETVEPAPLPGVEENVPPQDAPDAPALPEEGPDTVPDAPEPPEGRPDAPLTEEELRYFQEEFFNGEGMNIRNQFLSSLYEDPADINLLELFYCGAGREERMEDAERAAFEEEGGFAECDVTKVSAVAADEVLLEYTGLTLAEMNGVGLDGFIYLPAYDAYYFGHGDTNYRDISFSSGEWKDGVVCLYYEEAFYDGAAQCVRLRETEEGGWQFLSNSYYHQPES